MDGPPCTDEDADDEDCISTDLANTATHEIGHVLGIDHSPRDRRDDVRLAPLGETSKRTLARDDIRAICSIYPAGEPVNAARTRTGFAPDHGAAAAAAPREWAGRHAWIAAAAACFVGGAAASDATMPAAV